MGWLYLKLETKWRGCLANQYSWITISEDGVYYISTPSWDVLEKCLAVNVCV